MVEVYSGAEKTLVSKQRKKTFIMLFVLIAIYLVATVAVTVYFSTLPYKTDKRGLLIFINCLFTVIMLPIVYVYSAIRFGRVNAYNKILTYMDTVYEIELSGTYLRTGEELYREGVEFVPVYLLFWSELDENYFERQVLFDREIKLPNFNSGDLIKFYTKNNIVVKYEFLTVERSK